MILNNYWSIRVRRTWISSRWAHATTTPVSIAFWTHPLKEDLSGISNVRCHLLSLMLLITGEMVPMYDKGISYEYPVRLVDSPNKHTYNHIHCNITEHAKKMVWSTNHSIWWCLSRCRSTSMCSALKRCILLQTWHNSNWRRCNITTTGL